MAGLCARKFMINDFFVIIRSVGERTEKACSALLGQLFLPEQILTIRQSPFTEMLRQSFTLAIESNLPWTLCVDADVLIDLEQLPKLIKKATEMDAQFFEMQGLILDKFFQIWKPAGNHVYRTSMLETAIRHIPDEGTSLRPETDMLMTMSKHGHPWMQCEVKVGVHDFEQYYVDIYRKCFLHGIKHRYWLTQLEELWSTNAAHDFDYTLALIAAQAGKNFQGQVMIDKSFNHSEFEQIKQSMGILEKPEFDPATNEDVSKILANAAKLHSTRVQEIIFPQKLFSRAMIFNEDEANFKDRTISRLIARITSLKKSIQRLLSK
jgi:hypothetical protein